MTFHNTTQETGTALEASRKKASYQDEKVLSFFQSNPKRWRDNMEKEEI